MMNTQDWMDRAEACAEAAWRWRTRAQGHRQTQSVGRRQLTVDEQRTLAIRYADLVLAGGTLDFAIQTDRFGELAVPARDVLEVDGGLFYLFKPDPASRGRWLQNCMVPDDARLLVSLADCGKRHAHLGDLHCAHHPADEALYAVLAVGVNEFAVDVRNVFLTNPGRGEWAASHVPPGTKPVDVIQSNIMRGRTDEQ